LRAQNKLIGSWIRNDSELVVANTYNEKRIGDYNSEDMKGLVEVMAKWRLLLGVNNTDSTEVELVVICQFIYDNFKRFTLEDIKLAMNWAISGKIDMQFVSTKSINAMYVSKALNQYEEEKRAIVQRIVEAKESYERKRSREEKIEVTPKEKAETFKTLLLDAYNDYKQNGSFVDFQDFIYNWMRNNKILNPTQKDINDAMIYGETKLREVKQLELQDKDKAKNLTKYFESQDDDFRKKKFARNYVITKFFDKVQMGELIGYIKLEQFTNKQSN
jgi:hypothetical protein